MDIYEMLTKEFERQYDSTMTVKVYSDVPSDDDPFADGDWQEYLKDIPCRIAQKRQLAPAEQNTFATAEMSPYLYCNPKYGIPPGCQIFVKDRHGKICEYKRSGQSFSSYATHQEFMVNMVVKA